MGSGQRELNTLLFQNLFVIFKTNMSTFEDEFEIPAASEIDPAAEFLAKEQEELGDIGEDLGLGAPVQNIATFDDANDNIAVKNDEDENAPISVSHNNFGVTDDVNPFLQDAVKNTAPVMEGKDIYAGMQTLSIKKDQEEPEFMRIWREEQQERLRKKDEAETTAMDELKQQAKQELEDWEDETKYENNEMNHIEPGSEWERVAKHCDFSAKAPGHTKDVSRMRSIMLQLKQSQTIPA